MDLLTAKTYKYIDWISAIYILFDIFSPKHISFVELVSVMRIKASHQSNGPTWTLKTE